MDTELEKLKSKCRLAKESSRHLAVSSSAARNRALLAIAESIAANENEILAANLLDQNEAVASGMDESMFDRLVLNPKRLGAIAADINNVASLPDPIGEVFDMRTLPNGLVIGKKRVPLGVIAAIYESRPNVTADIAALAIKAGSSVILRGGKETFHSNVAIVKAIHSALVNVGFDENCVQFIDNTSRELVPALLKMTDLIDLVIPRGGSGLITFVRENSAVPVVAGGAGVCHTFVDSSAKILDAVAIAFNAKVQKPSACNALDTLLVHRLIATTYLPLVAAELARAGVELHCDSESLAMLYPSAGIMVLAAAADDWGKEFLAPVLAIKVVGSLDEALEHIATYGDGHSEAIVTEDYSHAQRFLNEVDAACVYVNASTRFTDGAQFGLGAELGISTQKTHARGPLGLKEITSYKWIIYGSGQVRGN